MYRDIKSEYIKKKIRKTRWGDRDSIRDLIRIEKLALGKNLGLFTGYARLLLPKQYQ